MAKKKLTLMLLGCWLSIKQYGFWESFSYGEGIPERLSFHHCPQENGLQNWAGLGEQVFSSLVHSSLWLCCKTPRWHGNSRWVPLHLEQEWFGLAAKCLGRFFTEVSASDQLGGVGRCFSLCSTQVSTISSDCWIGCVLEMWGKGMSTSQPLGTFWTSVCLSP